MSKLFVTVYRSIGLDDFGRAVPAPMTPPLANLYVDITHEPKTSPPFPQYASFIVIKPEVPCCIAFGEDPVADPDFHKIEAGERLTFGVQQNHRISVVESI